MKMEDTSDYDYSSEDRQSSSAESQTYWMDTMLSIATSDGEKTMKVAKWITDDPLTFDKARKELSLNICNEAFNVLVSKLRVHHPDYFRDALGLNVRIRFKGYDLPVKAIVLYKDHPVEFYKWWYVNQNVVNMTLSEKIRLFDQVNCQDQKVLKKEHKKMIGKK